LKFWVLGKKNPKTKIAAICENREGEIKLELLKSSPEGLSTLRRFYRTKEDRVGQAWETSAWAGSTGRGIAWVSRGQENQRACQSLGGYSEDPPASLPTGLQPGAGYDCYFLSVLGKRQLEKNVHHLTESCILQQLLLIDLTPQLLAGSLAMFQ
jgi:hypothetical protein